MIFPARKIPKLGDRRKRVKFALFPKTLADGRRIWLESYFIEEAMMPYTTYMRYIGMVDTLRWREVNSEPYIYEP